MNNEVFKPNYEHFADIVSLSVGRVLQNERQKGSTYSYGTFCINIEHQIGSHFGIEPEIYFEKDGEANNCKYFSKEVVELFEDLKKSGNKNFTSEQGKEFYEKVISLMNKYGIEIIGTEEYWEHWSNDEKNKTI